MMVLQVNLELAQDKNVFAQVIRYLPALYTLQGRLHFSYLWTLKLVNAKLT